MERREKARRWRRLKVRFWTAGSEKALTGYSTNISASGIYIATNKLPAEGSRIRVELASGDRGLMMEAVVVRQHRSLHRSLHGVLPSGVGVRFLTVDEIVAELLPEIATTPYQVEILSPEERYRLAFDDRKQFLKIYNDMLAGSLFIPTEEPAPIHKLVTIEFAFSELGVEPLSVMAQVVYRIEPSVSQSAAEGGSVTGMGVEFLDLDGTLKSARALVAGQLEQPSPRGP